MKALALGLAFAHSIVAAATAADAPRQRLLLDFGWKFHFGDDVVPFERLDKAGVNPGPAGPSFNDLNWRTLNLPHDWAVELPFQRDGADGNHGFKPIGPGWPSNSIAWYRRSFRLPAGSDGERLSLEFDGVYRNCHVFVNGYLVGHHESGYSSFRYDITDVANRGGENTLAVRVDASEFEGWFYEGAGIYRHVWLVTTGPLHVAPDGTFVYSRFPHNVPKGSATVCVQTCVQNEQDHPVSAEVACEILDPGGKSVAHFRRSIKLGGWTNAEAFQSAKVSSPAFWSPETPRLYKLVTTVLVGGAVADRTETEFGIRTVAFDPVQGFLLNGRHYEVKGTCNHQDHAGVGSALPDRLQYFRVGRLKDMGSNAIRTSHNAPTPELLDACDRLGMLVMDENRLLGSDPQNLAYLAGQIRRDRNHPSVFIWSLFNEEAQQNSPSGARVTVTMQRLANRLDPTRLCTAAASNGDTYQGVNSVIDVRGWNYFTEHVDRYHKAHPAQPEIGTEQASTVGTRGIYANDPQRGYVTADDEEVHAGINSAEQWWKVFAARPWLSGGFVWTGFDYRGEPTPYGWPCINSHFGIMDTCGFPKDNFYYYQSWWSDRTVLHLMPHWTWPGREGQDIKVSCFSNCREVELFLNGQSLGRQTMPPNSRLRWHVKYAPGTLLAKGFRDGQVVVEERVETTSAPARLKLTPDRATIAANGEDVSVVTVTVLDEAGRVVPVADNHVEFSLTGPGKIIGVGNGDPSCHEPDVYIVSQPVRTIALNDWRCKRGVPYPQPPEVADKVEDADWAKADVESPSGPLTPGETAVFRTEFEATPDIAAATTVTLNFGMIDDEGWIYVNGHKVGESHDWSAQPYFVIQKFLRPGANSIAVAVKNNAGDGGLNKGVRLEARGEPVQPHWQRSVFNGLAEVIVQTDKQPGTLTLTADSPGLESVTLDLTAAPAEARPAVPCAGNE